MEQSLPTLEDLILTNNNVQELVSVSPVTDKF